MLNQLLLLLVGFVLTTVLGGALGVFFQTRSWKHQYQIQLREQERERAVGAFEEISRLMDKRLYRLRQLYWGLVDKTDESSAKSDEERMDGYRAVLYEWNDSLNRNLAILQQYFGVNMRDRLDNEIGSQFVEIGGQVEELWKESAMKEQLESYVGIGDRMRRLSDIVYTFNIDMIRLIQSGSVGRFNPEVRR